tara:strand:+ start:366 stop:596 length:231 start_codon:yes stop_codon:yes gene_type:complete
VVYKNILVGRFFSRVFQRPGRGGYCLGIALPRELRKKLRKSEIIRKLSVIISFPSKQAAIEAYNSTEYKELTKNVK